MKNHNTNTITTDIDNTPNFIFDNIDLLNQIPLLDNININPNLIIQKSLIKKFEDIDKQLYLKIKEYCKKYELPIRHRGYQQRVLKTQWGKLVFKRRKVRINNADCFLLDKKLGLNKYCQYNKNWQDNVLKQVLRKQANLNWLKNGIGLFNTTHRQVAKTIDKLASDKKKEFKSKISLDENKPLYVNVDDTWITVSINRKFVKKRFRLVVMHQGKNKDAEFVNRTKTIVTSFSKTKDIKTRLWEVIVNLIKSNYFGAPKEIIISTDGAREFVNCAKQNQIKHIIDKYHVMANAKKVYIYNVKHLPNEIKEELKNIFIKFKKTVNENPNFCKLINLVNLTRELFKTNNLLKETRRLLLLKNYLIKNEESINSWKEVWYYPVTTESFMFHDVKKILGDKARTFSLKRLVNLFTILGNCKIIK